MKLVNHCEEHRRYTAGCEACSTQSKAYRAQHTPGRQRRTSAYGPPEHWERMTEIGLRHEGGR